jgi:FkbM family methyltransferase
VDVITTEVQLSLLNSYRQYLVRREGHEVSPNRNEVVLDCGACIGEVSLLFASMVGPGGAVHLFDPIGLHTRFCAEQGALNPGLRDVLKINTLAVGDQTKDGGGNSDLGEINPGKVSVDDFACTTLDDYCRALDRVDFIKMDIERPARCRGHDTPAQAAARHFWLPQAGRPVGDPADHPPLQPGLSLRIRPPQPGVVGVRFLRLLT